MAGRDHNRTEVSTGGAIAALAVFGLASNILSLSAPLFILVVYDVVLPAGSTETLAALLLMLAFAQIVQSLVDLSRARILARIGARLRQAAPAPAVFHGRTDSTPGAGLLQGLLSSPAALQALDLPLLPIVLCALFLLHPLMGWLAVSGMVLLAAIRAAEWRLAADPAQRLEVLSAQSASDMARAATAAPFLAATGQASATALRWKAIDSVLSHGHLRLSDIGAMSTILARGLRGFLQSAAVALGAWLAIRGQLSGGAIVAGSLLLSRSLGPFEQALAIWPSACRAWRFLRQSAPAPTTRRPWQAGAGIEAQGLTVRPNGLCILDDISFTVGPGQVMLVLGRSGSGKSALIRAIAGAMPLDQGRLTLGGAAISSSGAFARPSLGYLPERPVFGPGSVAEVIAGWGAARSAARAAGIEGAILSLPQGFDTPISTAEDILSGGQLRLLALARALSGNPEVLLLDDPDPGGDAEARAVLFAALRAARERGACVVVAARQSTLLPLCDLVLILEGGRARAFGPVAEVLRDLPRHHWQSAAGPKAGAA
ncbi:ATP-binding cassette domain-containing protein [Defluviimonas sp. WL0002]|uniref:ATP-binding cassette domain-containing protein n=1 Tax=Albidovulum marisflavi TaxID=2984159 RepID=A0ABT2ZET4_9RHOB|nr:ATP-binding cassette domain-containing protein [Defluviimonas sp. WL0002]MCV2869639.1 ATP-binding cassette domain-containing protein [Defluviimonas sp. WL0002]